MIKINLDSIIEKLEKYSELRVQEIYRFTIVLMNGNLVRNEKTTTSGVGARVFKDGSWGFSSKGELNDNAIDNVLSSALSNAEFLSSKNRCEQAPYESKVFNISKDYSTEIKRWTQKQIVTYLTNIDNYIKEAYPDLVSRQVVLSSIEVEKNIATSDGTKAYTLWPGTIFSINLTVKNNGELSELDMEYGGRGNLEDFLISFDEIKSDIDTLYNNLQLKKKGVHPIAGIRDVILDADLAGMLAHEAFGHTVEADLVRNGSIAGQFLNKQVASPLISIVDFAHTYNGERLPVPMYIDDEGVECKDALIIENGILKNYLHNRDSAYEFGHENMGNARAWQYSDEPLIRMRNTAIIPGKSKLGDMIASIDDGYYFKKKGNGQADTTGEFMFAIIEGYEVKNGKLGKAIKNTTISGKAFEVLSSVTMVSDEMKWSSIGMCGKKQLIPVGMGGPAIKCKVNVGGK